MSIHRSESRTQLSWLQHMCNIYIPRVHLSQSPESTFRRGSHLFSFLSSLELRLESLSETVSRRLRRRSRRPCVCSRRRFPSLVAVRVTRRFTRPRTRRTGCLQSSDLLQSFSKQCKCSARLVRPLERTMPEKERNERARSRKKRTLVLSFGPQLLTRQDKQSTRRAEQAVKPICTYCTLACL